jgi:DNA invertase Pin-like site-specific DNA recombinase
LPRAGDTLAVRWVDRLGRNYKDVTDNIREFMKRGVIVRTVINGLTFGGATKDPMPRQGGEEDAYRGRKPQLTRKQFEIVRDMLAQEAPITTIATTTGLSRQTVYRIKDDAAWAVAALERWKPRGGVSDRPGCRCRILA